MILFDEFSPEVARRLSHRAAVRDGETERLVAEIIDDVRHRGDAALLDSARRYDAPSLESIVVSEAEIAAAQVSADALTALQLAHDRVLDFHRQQASRALGDWRSDKGSVGQRILPLSRVGIYVPGGRAAYPSSVFMNVLPARAAGVSDVLVTSPAQADGTLPDSVLVALRLAGVTRAYKVGGAAAIAALALGTESVPRVDKVAGPGNRFVNEAKRQLWGQVGVDGYAGPSEVCVIADDAASAAFAAADLLTQIEHAPDNVAFLITVSIAKRAEILAEIEAQLVGARHEDSMRVALSHSIAVVVPDLIAAADVANTIAPEHLSVAVADPDALLPLLRNAGCVLLGEHSPESAGDYVAGPSHTLPTGGAARWQSPVNVLDFVKIQSIIQLGAEELAGLIPAIDTLATLEGFPAHARGATIRQ